MVTHDEFAPKGLCATSLGEARYGVVAGFQHPLGDDLPIKVALCGHCGRIVPVAMDAREGAMVAVPTHKSIPR
jgi:hypothetical protein